MSIQKISTKELQQEIQRRLHQHKKLEARRAKILAELPQIEAELKLLGGGWGRKAGERSAPSIERGTATARATRRNNPMTLKDAIIGVVPVGSQVTPAQAVVKVREAGYQSDSRTFGMQVAGVLAKDQRFEKKSRGLYLRVA
jgi:hypothetical protein